MKGIVLLTLGLAAPAPNLFGQGHVLISNYMVAPYNQILIGPIGVGPALNDPSVPLAFFYAPNVVVNPSELAMGPVFAVNPTLTYDPGRGYGPGGYYDAQRLVTPTVGIYTVELRWYSGGIWWDPPGGTGLFQVTTTSTSLPADLADVSPYIAFWPEPSTASLLCLGSLALALLRGHRNEARRQE